MGFLPGGYGMALPSTILEVTGYSAHFLDGCMRAAAAAPTASARLPCGESGAADESAAAGRGPT
eukprot:2835907-Prymnesium_polylepis.1